jgi:CheY-like chemotaxis protein
LRSADVLDILAFLSGNMNKTVLLVEDDEMVREMIEMLLRDVGYDVISDPDGQEVFLTIRESKPDIVLLDIKLPELDGRDICRAIKNDPATSHIPVVMNSGAPDVYNCITYHQANDVVAKPFTGAILTNRLARQLA